MIITNQQGSSGTLISDHESTFQSYGTRHQECLVHVERYLHSSVENEPELEWNREMLEWIKTAIHYWNGVHEGGTADGDQVSQLEAQYDKNIEKAKGGIRIRAAKRLLPGWI